MGTALVIGGIAGLALVGVVWAVLRWLDAQPKWRPVTWDGITFHLSGDADDVMVGRALSLAMDAFSQVWSIKLVRYAVQTGDLHVQVMPGKSWLNIAGARVGGEQYQNHIRVCADLSSLAHELAHFLQWRLDDGKVDYAHVSWNAGIWQADDAYRAALKGPP